MGFPKRPNGNPVFFFFCLEKKGKKIGRFLDAKNLSTWPEDDDEGGFCFGINIQRNENHHNLKNIWQIQNYFVCNTIEGFFLNQGFFPTNGKTELRTECDTGLDSQREMIIFESILTTFEASIIFWGSWGSTENQLMPMKFEPQPS